MPNNDPVQIVKIADFSPGIVQYSIGTYALTYPVSAPLGSCSNSYRCVNRPNVGLVPFYGYNGNLAFGEAVPTGNSPAGHPWDNTKWLNAGIGCIGGVGPNTFSVPQLIYPYSDQTAIAYMGIDTSGDQYSIASTFWTNDGLHSFNVGARMWVTTTGVPVGTSFDATSQQISAGDPGAPMLFMSNLAVGGGGVPYTPDILGLGGVNYYGGATGNNGLAAFAATSRVVVIKAGSYVAHASGVGIEQDDMLYWSDPPSQANGTVAGTFSTTNVNQYSLEETSGFGAWGSISTGETILIRRGQGAVLVNGDIGNPISVIKLPAVQGTGQIMQSLTGCNAGGVYVTQTNGVYAWNGGNTSTKISNQLPDQACVRQELENGGWIGGKGFVGCRSWHDVLNDYVFFPNNLVFDSNGSSWWQCEDPNLIQYGGFAASKSMNRLIYAAPKYSINSAGTVAFENVAFDATMLMSSYRWVSNPVTVNLPDKLASLQTVEIIASNPSSSSCTITVTPTVPPNQSSSFNNIFQPLTFNIPPTTMGWRGSMRAGFNEYNICVQVDAVNSNPNNPAPVLHQINLGFTPIISAGTGQ